VVEQRVEEAHVVNLTPCRVATASAGVPGEKLGARSRSCGKENGKAVSVGSVDQASEVKHPPRGASSPMEGDHQRPTIIGRGTSGQMVKRMARGATDGDLVPGEGVVVHCLQVGWIGKAVGPMYHHRPPLPNRPAPH